MKSIHIYIEYILLILLSAITFYLVFTWWINNKIYAINFYNQNQFEYQAKYIGDILYNLQNDYFYNIQINLNVQKIYCSDNLTIIQSNNYCKTTLNNITYQGPVIYDSNNLYYVYDPILNGYYILQYKYGSILYGCYQNKISVVLITNNCKGICAGNCVLNLEKNGTIISSYIT
ncbi:hypothetical protein YN1_2460 [Nanoarchaeota archaeon]